MKEFEGGRFFFCDKFFDGREEERESLVLRFELLDLGGIREKCWGGFCDIVRIVM